MRTLQEQITNVKAAIEETPNWPVRTALLKRELGRLTELETQTEK